MANPIPRASVSPPADTPCARALSRVAWADGLAFACHGVRLGLRVSDAALCHDSGLMARLRDCLPPDSTPTASPPVDILYSLMTLPHRSRPMPGPSHFLYRDSCRLAHSRDLTELLRVWESELHCQVAAYSRERLFVHAGVVGWQGRAIILPGRSFHGKTTLTAALVRAGATYLSDEYAAFDPNGLVFPYAKALSLRDAQGRSQGSLTADALGGVVQTAPLPVGLVLCCRYAEGSRWQPRPLSSGRALLALLENTVPVRDQPQKTLETLREVVRTAQAFGGRRGEADQVVAWLQAREKENEAHASCRPKKPPGR